MGLLIYIQQIVTEIKEEKHSNTIIVGDLILYLYQWIDHGLGLSVTGFQQLSMSTNNAGLATPLGFTSSPYTPTPKSFLLRRKVRLEILANEDADVDKEIWSKSDHKCWQLPSEHDLEKGCWLKVQLRAGGPCESQQKVTRRHLHLWPGTAGEGWEALRSGHWEDLRKWTLSSTTSEVKGSRGLWCLWCENLEHSYGIYWLNACQIISPSLGFLVLTQETW